MLTLETVAAQEEFYLYPLEENLFFVCDINGVFSCVYMYVYKYLVYFFCIFLVTAWLGLNPWMQIFDS